MVEDLTDWLDSAYSFLAMVNYPYPSNFLMPLPAYPIREVSLDSIRLNFCNSIYAHACLWLKFVALAFTSGSAYKPSIFH